MTQHVLTTHAGSLPRSENLVSLHAARFRGQGFDANAFAREVERVSAQVIDRQIEAGLDLINDGEVAREGFFTFVQHHMTGFGGKSNRPLMRDIAMYPSFMKRMFGPGGPASGEWVDLMSAPQAVGPVTFRDLSPITEEVSRVTQLLTARGKSTQDAFMTAPSPGIIAAAMENKHYPDLDAYIAALGKALTPQYKAITDAGFTLQIDAPDLAMERHTLFADKPLADFLHFARRVVAAIDLALDGLPRDRVRLHVCWGNYNAPHECDVPLADIWPAIAAARVGAFVMSLANPRHEHEVAFFRGNVLPANVKLIAGVIDTTTSYVEHPEVVALRIERAAEVLGDPSRVMAGTDCGFETTAGFSAVAEEVVWAKLRALGEGARIASKRLL